MGGGEELQRDSGETFFLIPLNNSLPPFSYSEPLVPTFTLSPYNLHNTKRGNIPRYLRGGGWVGEDIVQGGVLWPEFPPFLGPGVVTTPP